MHGQVSPGKVAYAGIIFGCSTLFVLAGFFAAHPTALHAPVAARPLLQSSKVVTSVPRVMRSSAFPVAAFNYQVPETESTTKVNVFLEVPQYHHLFDKVNVAFVPLAFGIGALAAVAASLLQKGKQPLATLATSGVLALQRSSPKTKKSCQRMGDFISNV